MIKLEGITTEQLIEVMVEVHYYGGGYENIIKYENDADFFDTFFVGNPFEVARSTFYGDYNFGHEMVGFNGYGNLESSSVREYEEEVESYRDEIIEQAYEYLEDGSIDLSHIF